MDALHIMLHAALFSSAFIIFITTAIQDRMRILASAAQCPKMIDKRENGRCEVPAPKGTFMHFCHE
jgi:hypothetical protein